MKFASIALFATASAQQSFLKEAEQFMPSFTYKNAEPTTPCCHACEEPLEKYYSVDHIFNNCGEACMDPSKYWLYKLFEPGLEKSDTNTPCADRQYTNY